MPSIPQEDFIAALREAFGRTGLRSTGCDGNKASMSDVNLIRHGGKN